jgi:hypothetical protein
MIGTNTTKTTTMDNEDFVSYEIAQALKKAEFDWPTHGYYHKGNCADDEVWYYTMNPADDHNHRNNPRVWSAPTLTQAQKWLREIIGIHVSVTPAIQIRKWQFYIDDLNQHINPHDGEMLTRCTEEMQDEYDKEYFDTYESALSAGIEAALKQIDEGEE